jgi:DNA-binding transcriptional MocR family regulator
VAAVELARTTYGQRRAALRSALAVRGVRSSPGSGVNLWVEADDEGATLITLAAAGIRASPGGPFLAADLDRHHIRVTSGVLGDGLEEVAAHLALAARTPGSQPVPTASMRRRAGSAFSSR